MITFESERLILKPLTESNITDEYVEFHNNEKLLKFYSSSGKKFTKDFILNELKNSIESGDQFIYGLFYKENNALIGNIKIGPVSSRHQTSDLVVFIGDTNYLGKGLAVEGIKLGNRVAFEKHDVRKLFGGMFRSNIASVKAYTRADWIIEGVLEGQYVVEGNSEDRILVACFNPKYFNTNELARKSPSIEDVYSK